MMEGHIDRVWNCAWSPSGDLLATCSGDKTVAQKLKDHERTVRRVAFSPDGKMLATASFDSTTSIYELIEGKFKLVQHLEGHDNEVKGVAWDCSGSLLATCSRDKSVWIYLLESDMQMDCTGVGQSHSQDVKSVVWHPTRELLLSCSYDDTMKIWQEDADDWNCTETITGHTSTVWDAAFEPIQGNWLVSCSEDRSLSLWRFTQPDALPRPGDEISRFKRATTDSSSHPRTIYSVDWSRTNDLIVTGGADDSIRIFGAPSRDANNLSTNNNTSTNNNLATNIDSLIPMLLHQPKAHASDINCVKWHPKEMIFASCGDDHLVRLWKYTPSQ